MAIVFANIIMSRPTPPIPPRQQLNQSSICHMMPEVKLVHLPASSLALYKPLK